jgi:hypothetical protein
MSAGGHGSSGDDLAKRGQQGRDHHQQQQQQQQHQQHPYQQQQQQDMRRHIRIIASSSHPDAILQPSRANSMIAVPIHSAPASSTHPTNRVIDFNRISDEDFYGAREREAEREKEREREWDREWEREWEREQGREYKREHEHERGEQARLNNQQQHQYQLQQYQQQQQPQQEQGMEQVQRHQQQRKTQEGEQQERQRVGKEELERELEAQALNKQQQHRYQMQQQQRQQQQQQRQEHHRIKREKKEEAKYTDTENTPAWLVSRSEQLSIAEPPKKQAREQRKSILQTFFQKNPAKPTLLTQWITHDEVEIGRQPKVVDLWLDTQRTHDIQQMVIPDFTSAQREQGVFLSTASRPTPVKSPQSRKGQGMHSNNTRSLCEISVHLNY